PIRRLRHCRVRLRAKLALAIFRDERCHQLAVADGPGGGAAHRLLGHVRHRSTVEVRPVLHQLYHVEHRLARGYSDHRKEELSSETMAFLKDLKPHAHCLPSAVSRAASAISC